MHLDSPRARRSVFLRNADGQSSTCSAIDHIGFSFANLDAKSDATPSEGHAPRPLKLAGGATVNFAYLEGPAGAKIERVQR